MNSRSGRSNARSGNALRLALLLAITGVLSFMLGVFYSMAHVRKTTVQVQDNKAQVQTHRDFAKGTIPAFLMDSWTKARCACSTCMTAHTPCAGMLAWHVHRARYSCKTFCGPAAEIQKATLA